MKRENKYKHLKKFNEFFDTEELKSSNEIPYMTGDIKGDIKNAIKFIDDYKNVDDKSFVKIVNRLSQRFPYFTKVSLEGGLSGTDGKGGYSFGFKNENWQIAIRYDDNDKICSIAYGGSELNMVGEIREYAKYLASGNNPNTYRRAHGIFGQYHGNPTKSAVIIELYKVNRFEDIYTIIENRFSSLLMVMDFIEESTMRFTRNN